MPHRSLVLLRLAVACVALTSLPSSTLHAQALRLTVTEEGSARPVAGGVADVLDGAGNVVVQGILGADGRRVLALPAGRGYRVRIRRIGFEPFSTAAPVIPASGVVDLTLALPARRVVLSTITVLARPLCARDAFRDPGVSSLWTEIRTALATTALSRADSSLSLESRSFRRHLEPSLELSSEQVGLPRQTVGGKPYVSRSAEDLTRDGYVRREGAENVFYAPDEAVLLSDQFVEDHCFIVQRGEGATEGLFGLRFQPAPRRNLNDIVGTLWVDSASAELRYLDFWYANDGFPYAVVGEGRSGGQVLFERVHGGLWIVSAWRLRMPRFAEGRRVNVRSTPDWYEEFGGVVSSLASDSLTPFGVQQPYRDMLASARVAGVIYDSVAGRPLAGAHVWLLPEESGADVAAGLAPTGGRLAAHPVSRLTDVGGHFEMDSLPSGTWRLAFEHPDLDSLGVRMPFFDIHLRPGASVTGVLGVPSMATLREGCATPAGGGPPGGMITGEVQASGDERPLQGALVRATWTDLRRAAFSKTPSSTTVETHTDSLGEYRLCGVPDSTIATVVAAGPHSATGGVQAVIGSLGMTRVNLRLAEVAEGELAPAAGILVGTVRDSLAVAVVGAEVLLDGDTSSVRTDGAGEFRLTGVEAGTQTIEVRRVGLDPARLVVNIVPGTTTTVSLTLIKSRLLDPILVTAQRMRNMPGVSDAIRRHRTGAGKLILEDEIKRSATVQSVLQGISGVRVTQRNGGLTWEAMLRRGGGECVARLFLDGNEVDSEVIASLTPDDIAAVEVYVRATSAPILTAGRSPYGRDELCGSILFWEKH